MTSCRQRAPKISEAQLQQQVYEYLCWALPDDAVPFAIPNGGSRHILEAANLKKTGTVAGVPDMVILYNGRALFVELKTKRGSLSEAQKRMIGRINRAKSVVAVCRSLDEMKVFLSAQGVRLRGERTYQRFSGPLDDMVRDLPDDDLDRTIDAVAGE